MTRWHYAAGAALLLAAFALGRYTAREPDRTETTHATEQARVQTVEVAMAREEWVTRRESDTTRTVTRTVYRERLPDGTQREIERQVEGEAGHVVEAAAGQGEAAAGKVEVREVVREVERRVEVRTPLPDWRVGGLVGYSGGLVYGGQVERRVLGPVSVGAWGMGGAGVMGGVSVGIDL